MSGSDRGIITLFLLLAVKSHCGGRRSHANFLSRAGAFWAMATFLPLSSFDLLQWIVTTTYHFGQLFLQKHVLPSTYFLCDLPRLLGTLSQHSRRNGLGFSLRFLKHPALELIHHELDVFLALHVAVDRGQCRFLNLGNCGLQADCAFHFFSCHSSSHSLYAVTHQALGTVYAVDPLFEADVEDLSHVLD